MSELERGIIRIKEILETFSEQEALSNSLADKVPNAETFVGICGTGVGFEAFEILDGFVSIRKVTNPPGLVHICRAAEFNGVDYLGVSRYSDGIRAELALGNKTTSEDEPFLLGVGWHAAALIKLRGHSSLLCPTAANCSWDTVCAISNNSIRFRLLDDTPKHINISGPNDFVSTQDMEWVKNHWWSSLELRGTNNSRRFGLAFDLAYTWNQTSNLRIAFANLWFGLEALFGNQNDKPVTSKLVQRISEWLPNTTTSEIEELYDERCAAVHGRWIEDAEIGERIRETERLLRLSITKCIESKSTPLPDWE